jgi:hypothetical protein
MAQDKRELQGKLMTMHTNIINEISDIKQKNFEISDEDRKKVNELEKRLKLVAESLYRLYNE